MRRTSAVLLHLISTSMLSMVVLKSIASASSISCRGLKVFAPSHPSSGDTSSKITLKRLSQDLLLGPHVMRSLMMLVMVHQSLLGGSLMSAQDPVVYQSLL